MPEGYALELLGVADGSQFPAKLGDGRLHGGKVRGYIATLDLANAAVKHANGDTNVLFDLPAGEKPIMVGLSASVTMGAAATIAIGTAAAPAKYRAAAIKTTTTLDLSMINTTLDDAPLADPETVKMTWGAADGPAAGTLIVIIFTLGR